MVRILTLIVALSVIGTAATWPLAAHAQSDVQWLYQCLRELPDHLLGGFSEGQLFSTANGDGSAAFIGLTSSVPDISRIEFFTSVPVLGYISFATGPLTFSNPDPVPGPVARAGLPEYLRGRRKTRVHIRSC